MKKLFLTLGLLLASASISFGQSLVTDAKPTCGTPQIGSYGIYEVAPSSDPSSGYLQSNPVPLGFLLCGTYSKFTVTMKTPVPAGETDDVHFGILDETTSDSVVCSASIGDTSCTSTGSFPFTYGDNIVFIIYIPGTGHSGYTVQNLVWRLE